MAASKKSTKHVRVEVLKITDAALPDQHNVNKHTQRGHRIVENSLRRRGAFRSIASVGKGVKKPVVMAGNLTLEKAVDAGFEEVINVHTDGRQLVNVIRDDIAPGTPEAIALGIEDNEASKQSYNPDVDMLAALHASDDQLMAALRSEDVIYNELVTDLIGDDQSGVDRSKTATHRKVPLDLILTLQGADTTCCIAAEAGWRYGINSGSYRLCPYTHYLSGRHEVTFVDNDYFKYDHGKHLEAVKTFKPKYCTVRDVMSEEQCEKAGIRWYPLDTILKWADELSKHAQNVIVIPKYDCLKEIPKKYMLGYSIPTSHGGTPLPVDLFRGRRLHLLGGAWKDQLAFLNELGDDVVSIDNNHVLNIARFGQLELGDGSTIAMTDLSPKLDPDNPRYLCLTISLGSMAKYVQDHYTGVNNGSDLAD